MLADPHLHSALQAYSKHLTSVEEGLAVRQASAEKLLKGYENAKGMGDITKRYAEVLKATDDVRKEIQKLETKDEQ